MKVCVSTQGETLDAEVESRFGRCANLIFVDTETLACECIQNPGSGASGGAGISAGQCVADNKAKALLTGNVGPNAFDVLNAAGIAVYVGLSGTVREAVAAYVSGALTQSATSSVDSHFGMQN